MNRFPELPPFEYRRQEIYPRVFPSSYDTEKKISNAPTGKLGEVTLENSIRRGVTIVSPTSGVRYGSVGNIFYHPGANQDTVKGLDKALDLIVYYSKPLGTLEFGPHLTLRYLPYTLSKYRKNNSTWNYRIYEQKGRNGRKIFYGIITVPKDKSEWSEILKALTEHLSLVKTVYGNLCQYHILEMTGKFPGYTDPRQRMFSDGLESIQFQKSPLDQPFRYRDYILYPTQSFSSIPKNIRLGSVRRGTISLGKLEYLISTGVSAILPTNGQTYKSRNLLYVIQEYQLPRYNTPHDIPALLSDTGFLEIRPCQENYLLSYILGTRRKTGSSWHYRIYRQPDYSSYRVIITFPESDREWADLLSCLTEFCLVLGVRSGKSYTMPMVPVRSGPGYTSPDSRCYSMTPGSKVWLTDKALASIPKVLGRMYDSFVYEPLMSKIMRSWSKSSKEIRNNYSPGLREKVIKYIEDNYSDKLIVANIGHGSRYYNLTKGIPGKALRGETLKRYRKISNSERLRTEKDYRLKAAEEGKDLITWIHEDPAPVIAHEFGHFLVNLSVISGNIQRGSAFSRAFMTFAEGIYAKMGEGIGGILKIPITTLLSMPTLHCEFMASYRGIEVLKKVGATPRDIENAKSDFSKAYSTYVLGSISDSLS